MKNNPEIDLEALARRVAAAGGKKKVAESARVQRNTLDRLMRGEAIRTGNLAKIAKALETTPEALLVRKERTKEEMPRIAAARQQFQVLVQPTFSNNLDLVAQRYGVSASTILQAAPLLFAILAEESLRERKKRVDEVRVSVNALMSDNLQSRLPSILYGAFRAERALDAESASIDSRNLDGDMNLDDEVGEEQSPFAEFLSRRLIELGCSDPDSADSTETTSFFVEHQTVFENEFEAIIKDDQRARLALHWGFARIEDIPPDLQRVKGESDARATARCDWLAAKFPDEQWESHQKMMREFLEMAQDKESA